MVLRSRMVGTAGSVLSGLVAGVVVLLGAVVKVDDVRRAREAETLELQTTLPDALLSKGGCVARLRHAHCAGAARRRPVVVELVGRVPDLEAREAAVHVVMQKRAENYADWRLEERIRVEPDFVAVGWGRRV